jgi:hypothetical protein
MPHYFTREEAEALLPQVSVVLREIQNIRQNLQTFEEEITTLKIRAMGNGHHLLERSVALQELAAEQLQLLEAAGSELQAWGCELKDPDSGLIDFLSLRNGEEIYLCWRLGEERILFWHPLDTGFGGRQPL